MGRVNFNPNNSIITLDVALFSVTSSHFRSASLVLDTGASKTAIIPDAILGLGYNIANAKQGPSSITASGIAPSKLITLSKLFAIGETVENIDILIQSFPQELTNMNIHGLLGLDFLRHFDVNICFSSGFIDIKRIEVDNENSAQN